MTITEAQEEINKQAKAGLISREEAANLSVKIRRTGDYGNKWSAKRQAEMRANLLK